MPIAKSDPRRATIVGVIGVIVGTVMILLVLFANNLGGGDVKQSSSKSQFDVGSADSLAKAINRDQTPLFFNDTATGSRPIVVHHLGEDPRSGWIAFDAAVGNCALAWHRESQNFTDCNGKRYPADGTGMHQYPATVENDHLFVNLSPDATTTSS